MVRDFKPAYGIDHLPSVRVTSQCTRTAHTPKTAAACITPGITQALSNATTVVLLLPIATAIATGPGLPPMAFIDAITITASQSFLIHTPVCLKRTQKRQATGG